jgi:cyclophilin family peptidyl-prolyl cis-trans isomerase
MVCRSGVTEVMWRVAISAGVAVALVTCGAHAQGTAAAPGAGSVVVLETVKGTIEFETYPDTAPQAVAHVLALVQKRFYAGLRFHRVVPNFVIQIGDPTTRDFTKRENWGSYSSGTPVGVSELSSTRKHVAGTVSLAHLGDASTVDSQFFICLTPQPQLDGKHPIIGRVISGMDVARKIAVADRLVRASVRIAQTAGNTNGPQK